CTVCSACSVRRALAPPTSTLFPYTTLFRSQLRVAVDHLQRALGGGGVERPALQHAHPAEHRRERCAQLVRERGEELVLGAVGVRSEEHTSELQSRGHLVCRLLLEKKN